ncbi:MAG: type VI secretion system accessory protein TagJ [Gemmataceae bacterium]
MTLEEMLHAAAFRDAVAMLDAEPSDDPAQHFMAMELKAFLEDFDGAMVELHAVEKRLPDRGIRQEFEPLLMRAKDWVHRQTEAHAEGHRSSLAEPLTPYSQFFDQAMHDHAAGIYSETIDSLEHARRLTPRVRGIATMADEKKVGFSDLWDADELTGPHLVCVHEQTLADVPFASLAMIEFLPPQGFQDVLWMPARVRAWSSDQASVRVFGSYVGTAHDASAEVRQLRRTRFDRGTGYAVGRGLRAWRLAAADDPSRISLVGINRIARIDFRK